MPNWWQSARGRYIVLQVLLWAILAGTVGLAAVVGRWRLRTLEVPLADPQVLGGLRVRLPEGWAVGHESNGVVAVEPVSPRKLARQVSIRIERAGPARSPLEFLAVRGLARPEVLGPPSGRAGASRIEQLRMAGQPAVLLGEIGWTYDPLEPDSPRQTKQITACALLPSRQAIIIRFAGPGPIDPADLDLVRNMAASVQVDAASAPD